VVVLLWVALLGAGAGVGGAAQTWRVVAATCGLIVVVGASGWAFGWTADSETPALGGAFLLMFFFGGPLVVGAAAGVAAGRRWWPRRRDSDSRARE
jgi:hypothetical protein